MFAVAHLALCMHIIGRFPCTLDQYSLKADHPEDQSEEQRSDLIMWVRYGLAAEVRVCGICKSGSS